MKLVRWMALLLATLAWAPHARAQAGDTAVIRAELGRVCPGKEVRLALASADTMRGYCGYLEDDRLLVRWGTDERRIPLEQVEALWVRSRGTGSGVRAGAIIGGLGVGGLFMFVTNGLCEAASGCGGDVRLMGVVGGILGALAGAGLGGIIGSNVNAWDRLYP